MEKNSILSPAETLNERERYDDVDVFGHEEEHDVCDFIYLFIYLFIESWFLSALMMIAQMSLSIHMKTDLSIYFFPFLFPVMFKSYRLTLFPTPHKD